MARSATGCARCRRTRSLWLGVGFDRRPDLLLDHIEAAQGFGDGLARGGVVGRLCMAGTSRGVDQIAQGFVAGEDQAGEQGGSPLIAAPRIALRRALRARPLPGMDARLKRG